MTTKKAIQQREVAQALGFNVENFTQLNSAAEAAIEAEHGKRIRIVEKPEDDVTGVFVDGALVLFLCGGERCEINQELVDYLNA